MIMKIYAIRDFLTGFLSPMIEQNDQVAIRNWIYAVNNAEQSQFFIHPQDYCLYRIGEYNTETGVITAYAEPEPVMSAIDAKKAGDKHSNEE